MKYLNFVCFALILLGIQPVNGSAFHSGKPVSKSQNLTHPVHLQNSTGNSIDSRLQFYFKTGTDYTWELVSTELDLNGNTHSRYQQLFKGINVLDAILVLHTITSGQSYVTGHFTDVVTHDHHPTLPLERLIQNSHIRDVLQIDEIQMGNSKLTWLADPSSGQFCLAYSVEYYLKNSLEKHTSFIHAGTGNIISSLNHSCYINTPGIAHTAYHGTCTITTSNQQGTFTLKSTNRGQGIETYNLNNQLNYFSVTGFYDNDNLWDQLVPETDKHATDAHFCAEQYYDFLLSRFGRNSIDNNGHKLMSYLNYGNGLLNAFWNGTAVVYGSGNQVTGPLTTLDIAGHEFTHGLIQKTANLNYSGEPGTINEALADIFGTTLEYYALPLQSNWTIGEYTGNVLRSMENPGLFNQPGTYKGTHWYYGTGDNGGIHINSGFINKWFHLLSVGGQGVNDNGWSYSVPGIGIENASSIVYHSLIAYLLPASGFNDFMRYSLQSTVDLYGTCSPEYLAVMEAWKAVGLSNLYQEPPVLNSLSGMYFCENEPVQLKVNGIPGSTFNWYTDETLVMSGNLPVMTVSSGGVYRVSEVRCGVELNSNTLVLQSFTLPHVTTNDVNVCSGDEVFLTGFPSGGIFSVPNPYTGPGTTFNYHFTDTNGCSGSATGSISILQIPEVTITNGQFSFPENSVPVELTGTAAGEFLGYGVVDGYFYPGITGQGGPFEVILVYEAPNGCASADTTFFYVEKPCIRLSDPPVISAVQSIMNGKTIIRCSVDVNKHDFKYSWNVIGNDVSVAVLNDQSIEIITRDTEVFIELILTNTCNDSTLSNRIIAIDETVHACFEVYPNPTYGRMNFRFTGFENSAPVTIEIHDTAGKLCWSATLEEANPFTWNIAGLTKGFYVVIVQQGELRKKQKLVIN